MGGLCQEMPKKRVKSYVFYDWQHTNMNTTQLSDYLQHTWQDGDQKLQGMIPTAKGNALRKCNTLVSQMCGEKIRNTFGKKYGIIGQYFLLFLRL